MKTYQARQTVRAQVNLLSSQHSSGCSAVRLLCQQSGFSLASQAPKPPELFILYNNFLIECLSLSESLIGKYFALERDSEKWPQLLSEMHPVFLAGWGKIILLHLKVAQFSTELMILQISPFLLQVTTQPYYNKCTWGAFSVCAWNSQPSRRWHILILVKTLDAIICCRPNWKDDTPSISHWCPWHRPHKGFPCFDTFCKF